MPVAQKKPTSKKNVSKGKVNTKPKAKYTSAKKMAIKASIGAGIAAGAIGSALLIRKLSKDPKVKEILEKIKRLSMKQNTPSPVTQRSISSNKFLTFQ